MSILATAPRIPAGNPGVEAMVRLQRINALAGVGVNGLGTDDPFQDYTDDWYSNQVDVYNQTTNGGANQGGTAGSTATQSLLNILNSWSATGQKILLNDSLPRGIYMSKAPNGAVTYYSQPTGSGSIPIANVSGNISATGGSMQTMMLMGAGVIALILVMQMSRQR